MPIITLSKIIDEVVAIYKPKEIASLLKIDYNQSFISFYERLKKEI